MDHEMSEEEFSAWCEWRKWCSVWRVKDPQPTEDELAAGIQDDKTPEEREKYYNYLYGYVTGSLSKWLNRWYEMYKEKSRVSANQKNELISIFDDYMKSSKKQSAAGFDGRSYKDYVFHQISESPDAPGRVLNGKIFGKQGYVREILKRYLMETEQLDQGPKGGVVLKPGTISEDTPLNDDDKKTLEDVLAGGEQKYDVAGEVVQMLKKLNPAREEKLVLWAVSHGIAVSNPELCKVLHCAKEKSSNTLTRVVQRMKKETPELLDAEHLHILLNLIFSEMEAEKEARTFLYSIVNEEEGDADETN